MATEIKSLSSGTYTLQMEGDGSVTCFYGSSTKSTPLVFTVPSATLVKFDTVGEVTGWHLHTGNIPLPYVPPGVTQPSAAATTGGNGLNVLMDRKILEALRGKPDGVELWNSGSVVGESGWTHLGGGIWQCSGGTTDLTSSDSVQTGSRVLHVFEILTRISGSLLPVVEGNGGTAINATGQYAEEIVAGEFSKTGLRSQFFFGTVKVLSIQRLAPAVCTVMHEAYMGVGSGDLTGNVDPKDILWCNGHFPFYFRGGLTEANSYVITSYDGSYYNGTTNSIWSANEIHRRYVQTNGVKFRVGYERFTPDMVPIGGRVWSHPTIETGAVFDSSFNPLKWLRFGLNLTVPIWHRKCWIDYKCLSDAEITYRNKIVGE